MILTRQEKRMKRSISYKRMRNMYDIICSSLTPPEKLYEIWRIMDEMYAFGYAHISNAYKNRALLLRKEWLLSLPLSELPLWMGKSDVIDEIIEERLQHAKNEGLRNK